MFRTALRAATALLLAGSLLSPADAADTRSHVAGCLQQAVTVAQTDAGSVRDGFTDCVGLAADRSHEICSYLKNSAPGWPPFVWITPEGDVYIWNGFYYEFIWDCPPYAEAP